MNSNDVDDLTRLLRGLWNQSHVTQAQAILASGVVVSAQDHERTKEAARTLGRVVETQCKDALDATGLHHLIDEDGDGDWGLVWEHLAEMGERHRTLVQDVEALADRWEREAGENATGQQDGFTLKRHAGSLRFLLREPATDAARCCQDGIDRPHSSTDCATDAAP